MFWTASVQGRDPRKVGGIQEGCRTSRHVTIWIGMQRQKEGEGRGGGTREETSVFTFLCPFLSPPLLSPLMASIRQRGEKRLRRARKRASRSNVDGMHEFSNKCPPYSFHLL